MTIIAKPYVTQDERDAMDWIFSPDNPANQEDTPEFKHLRSINPAIDDFMILPNEYSGKGNVFKNCKYK